MMEMRECKLSLKNLFVCEQLFGREKPRKLDCSKNMKTQLHFQRRLRLATKEYNETAPYDVIRYSCCLKTFYLTRSTLKYVGQIITRIGDPLKIPGIVGEVRYLKPDLH